MLTFLLPHLSTILFVVLLIIIAAISFLLGGKTAIEHLAESNQLAFFTTPKGELGIEIKFSVLGKSIGCRLNTCRHMSKQIAKAIMDVSADDDDGCHTP